MPELPDADDDLLEDDDLTDSVPRITPVYTDSTYREHGERLAALYFARDTEGGGDSERNEAIAKTAAVMRRGPRLHPGEFLADGRYRLIDSLGSGSGRNGHWKAWDRTEGRFVYLTVFHDTWADDDAAVDAFRARGRQLVALSHPNIGRVHEADRSVEGWVYVAQAFFAVGSLPGRVAPADFDAISALQVIVEVAEALRNAHDAGIVHGDVRPENVMLSADGTAHLVDFSVGPRGGAGWGSLYAAPESNERDYVAQPAADVYGLGMTALYALHKADLPVWVLRDPGKLIDAVEAPEAVKRVVAKATEWDLAKRYPDVRTLLRELMSDPELVRILADRALDRGRLDVGASHFEKLLKTQPHRGVEYRTILGDVYTRLGRYDAAHEHYARALERTPEVSTLFAPLRLIAERTNQWSRLAELLWTQARQRDAGRRVVLRAELADINEHQLDDPTSAREVWGQVLAEHRLPEQAVVALRALMRLCRNADDGEAFVAYGRELLGYLPEDSEAAHVEYSVGRVLIEKLERVDEGLVWIDRAESHGHTELDFAPALQQIRAERGQWQRVIRLMIAQARQQDLAEASPTLLRAGIIAGAVHHEEEAFEVYHSLLERAPRHVVALRHLARMHHRAHQHERALPFYERLWDTYKGRDTDEPEASERAADCAAYASILLRMGRADESMERLHEALRLTPLHVPTLQVAGPMLLNRGEIEAAADVFERMLRAFKSVERTPQKVEACLGMGDLAWVQGRVTPAMGWYNRALELEPFSVRAWWGLAKVALTARGGHPGVERAPWVKAVPKRFSTTEALARLLGAMLDPDAMSTWLRLTPLGSAIVEGGATPMRLACGVAEVLTRHELAGSDLYDRLGEAFPEWGVPIDTACGLCTEGRTQGFPILDAYAWSAPILGEKDFDPDTERHVLPPEPAQVVGTSDVLQGPAAWGALFQNARTEPVPPRAWIQDHEADADDAARGQVGALVRDQAVWLLLDRPDDAVRFGRDDGSDMQIVHDESVVEGHGRLFRKGGRIYVEAGEGTVHVDGEARALWRLVGGERVTIGETRFHFEAVDELAQLPPRRRQPVRRPSPAPVANEVIAADEEVSVEISEEAPMPASPPNDFPSTPDITSDDDPSVELEEGPSPTLAPDVEESGPEPEDVEAGAEEGPNAEGPDEVSSEEAEPVVASDEPVDTPEEPDAADAPEPADASEAADEYDEVMAMPSESEEIAREEAAALLAARASADVPPDEDAEDDEVIERVSTPDDDREDDEGVDAPPVPTLQGTPVIVDEEPPVRDDDEKGVFGFPAEFASDGSEELDGGPAPLPSGLGGMTTPSMPPEPMAAMQQASELQAPPADEAPAAEAPAADEAAPAAEDPEDPDSEATQAVDGLFASTGSERSGQAAALEYMSGAERGEQVEVGQVLTVGQSRHCGMSIPGDTRLSPVHCKVERTSLGYKLVDEGSANGTVVNGARITEIDLHGGEVIMVGRTVLRFRLLEEDG